MVDLTASHTHVHMNREPTEFYLNNGLFHSIHTSERKAFRACRRRWNWSYREGYHPMVTPKPLEFGIAYHTAMEVWYEPTSWREDRNVQSQIAIEAFRNVCKEQLDNYTKLNGQPDDEVLADYRERVDLGMSMVKYYTQRVSPKLDVGLTPLAVEIPFEAPMPLWCKCDACWNLWSKYLLQLPEPDGIKSARLSLASANKLNGTWKGLPVTFGGRIDAIFQDQDGRILVFDWKTTARILDDVDESAFLELDDQVGGYPVALWKLGRRVDGFIYHEQKKAVPGEPKLLKRAYKNKMYSTAKDEPVEYETFLNTVMREDLRAYNMGFYDEYLEYLQGPMKPKFFQRHTVYKTETQMTNFWNDLIEEAKDILYSTRVYPQASRFSCNKCLYRQPCEGMNRGEDYKYTLESMYVKG